MSDAPVITKVPHDVRRTRILRRKAALQPRIEERRSRQKKSHKDLKEAIVKPASGHTSPRPNRRVNRRKKSAVSTDA